ncbi:MAG: universal stress protein [Candidatus Tectimicrobiota bacterium]
MLQSILVGLDGSEYSSSAVDLGLQLASRAQAALVGLGIIDMQALTHPEPVPLGGSFYKEQRDALLSTQLQRQVEQALAYCTQQSAAAAVRCRVSQATAHADVLLRLEAQCHDVILLGQQTFFQSPLRADDTLESVLRHTPRPIIVAPQFVPDGQTVVIAYDGSLPAARTLQAFQMLQIYSAHRLHVVCVHAHRETAQEHVERACTFLRLHDLAVTPYALATERDPEAVLLEHCQHEQASLLVMGAYGQSTLREFFCGSLTRSMLRDSQVPLFLYH